MSEKRVFGLDILRASAVIFVMLAHFGARVNIDTLRYVSDYNPVAHFLFSGAEKLGVFGVEIFFVLSGFLIGQILIKQTMKALTPDSIRIFYIRRWFRTLPPYYLVLIGMMLIDNVRTGVWDFHPWYFVFLQNFFPSSLEFFNVSWSLAIEEWFYLLLPVLFFLTLPKEGTHSRDRLLAVILAPIALIVLMRILVVAIWDPVFDFGIRRNIPLHFDSLMMGVLLAHLRLQYRPVYQVLGKPWMFLLGVAILGGILTAAAWPYQNGFRLDQFVLFKAVGLPLIGLGTALCIPYLDSAPLVNQRFAANPAFFHFATRMSLYSYSLYLTHATIFYVFSVWFARTHFQEILVVQILAVLVSIGVSALLYHLFEKPCMNLRERFGPRSPSPSPMLLPTEERREIAEKVS